MSWWHWEMAVNPYQFLFQMAQGMFLKPHELVILWGMPTKLLGATALLWLPTVDFRPNLKPLRLSAQ